jgi:hypothetical protein
MSSVRSGWDAEEAEGFWGTCLPRTNGVVPVDEGEGCDPGLVFADNLVRM